MRDLTLTVNGERMSHAVDPRTHLADHLRETLHLTGTHLGCEHGVCGACTVLVDGRPVRSCITYAASCSGAEVRTVEGYGDDPVMAALRRAFSRHHALQCGYCTPGFLATAYDIVTRLPQADEARVREELAGNLCRCTGYSGIVAAILSVLEEGVPAPQFRPSARAPLDQIGPVRPAAAPATRDAAGDANLPPIPDRIDDPVRLERRIEVAVPPDALWATLRDIEAVARCLPGARLDDRRDDGTVTGAFAVSIGPMRARFGGRARVDYDDPARRGHVIGAGGDRISRSRAEGEIGFAAVPTDDGGASVLTVEIGYRLSGPLSQFGRPGVVADIVDRMLGEFAANLAVAAEGGRVEAAAPIGGASYALSALRSLLRRLLGRGD